MTLDELIESNRDRLINMADATNGSLLLLADSGRDCWRGAIGIRQDEKIYCVVRSAERRPERFTHWGLDWGPYRQLKCLPLQLDSFDHDPQQPIPASTLEPGHFGVIVEAGFLPEFRGRLCWRSVSSPLLMVVPDRQHTWSALSPSNVDRVVPVALEPIYEGMRP